MGRFSTILFTQRKKLFKISFSQKCTSNLVTDFDFELLTESFVNMHQEKLFWWKLSCTLP